ncbi:MAG: hypothetical protein QOE95_1514 [Gaiellaceae bacterium]|nr:hypothetical protein [Gaiellaceae bacterium]
MSSPADPGRIAGLAAAAIAATAIVATASASGGYFPVAWGWTGFALALAVAGALILVRELPMGRLDFVALSALSGLFAWEGLSAVWSASLPRTVLETQRDVVYVVGFAALLLLTARASAPTLAAAVLVGASVVAFWGLATRIVPEQFGVAGSSTGQLARPVGYWNALGILTVMGLLLALAAATQTGRTRAVAAALVPPLAVTQYLTYSRGAWLALVVGLVALVVLHSHRSGAVATTAALAPLAGAGMWLASTAPPHRLGLELALLSIVAAAIPGTLDRVPVRWTPNVHVSGRTRRAVAVAAAGASALGLFIFAGRAYDAFRSPTVTSSGDLNARLFSASGNARSDYWRVAWDDVSAHPVLGSGAGTYELRWYRDRPNVFGARDAHNLYPEKLAELGPVGLGLLLLALAAPLVALRRRARNTLVAGAGAAYVAFLAHAAVDWDWEMPTVTLAALACGATLLASGRPQSAPAAIRASTRAIALFGAAAVAAFALLGFLAAASLEASASDLQSRNFAASERAARRAARFEPWAAEPWSAVGEAQIGAGNRTAAVRSFRRAVTKDPADWFPWYELALASRGTGRRAAVGAGLRRNPRGPELLALQGH